MQISNLSRILLTLALCCACMTPMAAQREQQEPEEEELPVAPRSGEQLLDKVVVIVNEGVILLSELHHELSSVKERLRSENMALPAENDLINQVLEHMIVEKLQLAQAKRNGMIIDDLALNATLKNIASGQKLSLEQLKQKKEKEGRPWQEYREDLRKQMILNQLASAIVSNNVVVSEQEIDDFMAGMHGRNDNIEYLVSHIQISFPEAARPEDIQTAEKKAEDIYQKLQKGGDFAQLAIANSDARDALNGGDLGWSKLSELPSVFTKPLSVLKPGEFCRPIRSPRGFHILKLHETKGVRRHVIKQAHVRHILMRPNALTSDNQVHEKIADLRRQIQQGADFAKLANKFSEDPGSKDKGGDLGWNEPSVYAEQFKNVVTSLPINKISEPFKTEYGWHIAQVQGWRDYDDTSEYHREQAYRAIYRRKAAIEEEMWVRRLRSEAYIDYRMKI